MLNELLTTNIENVSILLAFLIRQEIQNMTECLDKISHTLSTQKNLLSGRLHFGVFYLHDDYDMSRNVPHTVMNLVENLAITENLFTADSWTEYVQRYRDIHLFAEELVLEPAPVLYCTLGVGFSLYPEISTLVHNDPIQRIRIIEEDAEFEPGTFGPEVWCSPNF